MGVKLQANWNLVLDFETDREIEILIDHFKMDFPEEGVLRVVVIQEPFFTLCEKVMKNLDFYDYVFTYHQEILDNNPKARYFIGLQSWINYKKEYKEEFAVSTVVGGKSAKGFPGYAIRHNLWNRQNEIAIPRKFYLSSHYPYSKADYTNNLVLKDRKEPMFDCMFHVAIENVYVKNLFSEKLIDCLVSRTIPIHYGTPNLGDYFNLDGIFVCNNTNEIIKTCNSLTPTIYNAKRDAMEDNYNRALRYVSYETLLKNKLMEILNEEGK